MAKKLLTLLLIAALLCPSVLCACRKKVSDSVEVSEEEIARLNESAGVFGPTIYIAGESTACAYVTDAEKGLDRSGWGRYLQNFFRSDLRVQSFATSGDSSRSYVGTESYMRLMVGVEAGDYVFIQFGHTDGGGDVAKATSPRVSRNDVNEDGRSESGAYSYEWFLYNKYVLPVQEAGGIPVLMSSVVKRFGTGEPSDYVHSEYEAVTRALAEELGLIYIDLNAITMEYYQNLFREGGADATALMQSWKDEAHTERESSLLSSYGAYVVAGLIADAVKVQIPPLAAYLAETPKPQTDK